MPVSLLNEGSTAEARQACDLHLGKERRAQVPGFKGRLWPGQIDFELLVLQHPTAVGVQGP